MIKVISAAALIAGMATASFAGNLASTSDSVVETVFAPQPSSAGLALPLAIAGGVLALGLILDDDDEGTTTTTVND
jgi:hypothetical protein